MGRSSAAPLHDRAEPAVLALAKISVLPTQIAEAHEAIAMTAGAKHARFNGVFYATGTGTIYFAGSPDGLGATLKSLREKIEALGGSLMIGHRPDAMPQIDAWGNAGDALGLMRAVKQQFDPKSTLNPGRFVGGI